MTHYGYTYARRLPDGVVIGTLPMLTTIALAYGIGETCYKGRYCYPHSYAQWSHAAVCGLVKLSATDAPVDPYWIKHKGVPEFNPVDYLAYRLRDAEPDKRMDLLREEAAHRHAQYPDMCIEIAEADDNCMAYLPMVHNRAEIWCGTPQEPYALRFFYQNSDLAFSALHDCVEHGQDMYTRDAPPDGFDYIVESSNA